MTLTLPDDGEYAKHVHLGQIIKGLLVSTDPKRYAPKMSMAEGANLEEEARIYKITTGLSLEIAIERLLMQAMFPNLFRPPSIMVDGVWMSPDGIDPEEWCPHEYKLTWYSMKKVCPFDPVFWPWVIQIKCYARALGALHGYLTVFFINSFYKPPRPHPPMLYKLIFTQYELDQCWAMVLKQGQIMGLLP